MKYAVGQSLWWVPAHRGGTPVAVTVQAVGRKWLKLSNHHQVDIQTLVADGGHYSSPGRCYQSEEAWTAYVGLCAAWDELRRTMSQHYVPPDGVTLSQIQNAQRSLFKRTADNETAASNEVPK